MLCLLLKVSLKSVIHNFQSKQCELILAHKVILFGHEKSRHLCLVWRMQLFMTLGNCMLLIALKLRYQWIPVCPLFLLPQVVGPCCFMVKKIMNCLNSYQDISLVRLGQVRHHKTGSWVFCAVQSAAGCDWSIPRIPSAQACLRKSKCLKIQSKKSVCCQSAPLFLKLLAKRWPGNKKNPKPRKFEVLVWYFFRPSSLRKVRDLLIHMKCTLAYEGKQSHIGMSRTLSNSFY